MKRIMTTLGVLIGNMTPAWAATTGREDNSGLFVWIFLGFCALIVVAQLIPAVMVVLGLVKGVRKQTVEVAPEVEATVAE